VDLKLALLSEAHRLGFLLAGVTTPDPPPHLEVYHRWLQQGRHGEMAYLDTERARQRRSDPRQILPECRSILCLAAPYAPPPSQEPPASGKGKIAAYAWGDDYHEVLADKLKALVAFIEAQVGRPVPNRWYTDTGPVLERDLAQRAGLGWIGKNTLLIHPRHGSYFFLAEILLGIDLEPDPPFTADHCGGCTRCIEACPTACILPDRTIDARRCISYLTIELKGDIPAGLQPQMGDWVFGCDVCQQVCPWNVRFAVPGSETALLGAQNFPTRPGIPRPELIAEIRLTQEEFSQKFRRSPIKRAKHAGYLRNVAVALGNVGRSEGRKV
jgi:epoxyqueuosine reductase